MMIFRTTRMALKSIANNKMRSFLTMLGIIIGVCSVITLVSVIQGLQRQTMESFAKMGTNTINAYYYFWNDKKAVDIEDDFYAECKRLNQYILGATRSQTGGSPTKYKSKTLNSSRIYAASDTFDVCLNVTLAKGRSIGYTDIKNKVRVCTVGSYVAKEFFGLENPIGKQIRINGIYFTVIGVYESKYNNVEYSTDNLIAVPRTCARLAGLDQNTGGEFIIKCRDSDSTQKAMFFLKSWLNDHLPENGADSSVYSNNTWQASENESMNTFTVVAGGIAGISLLVGGIGIMNIMLVSVAERTREIGIRMSIGAKRRDIITQFLVEASVISALGGLIGILIGAVGSAMLSSAIFKKAFYPSPVIAMGAFIFSVTLGIFFGFYPANKASKMQPVEALRNN